MSSTFSHICLGWTMEILTHYSTLQLRISNMPTNFKHCYYYLSLTTPWWRMQVVSSLLNRCEYWCTERLRDVTKFTLRWSKKEPRLPDLIKYSITWYFLKPQAFLDWMQLSMLLTIQRNKYLLQMVAAPCKKVFCGCLRFTCFLMTKGQPDHHLFGSPKWKAWGEGSSKSFVYSPNP